MLMHSLALHVQSALASMDAVDLKKLAKRLTESWISLVLQDLTPTLPSADYPCALLQSSLCPIPLCARGLWMNWSRITLAIMVHGGTILLTGYVPANTTSAQPSSSVLSHALGN